ncbi:hypothetical protein RCL_jg27498.t1 [Rhizophagus clarus]|uniref:Uncharacterized protein n=1 Tax=Rhizophagus clarus TaxID=94130 RepID=A0A8H3LXC7_9GLOM|nr:hypothetical protein RCL_jg27498.t1 [Rhizophagus clarus]
MKIRHILVINVPLITWRHKTSFLSVTVTSLSSLNMEVNESTEEIMKPKEDNEEMEKEKEALINSQEEKEKIEKELMII